MEPLKVADNSLYEESFWGLRPVIFEPECMSGKSCIETSHLITFGILGGLFH